MNTYIDPHIILIFLMLKLLFCIKACFSYIESFFVLGGHLAYLESSIIRNLDPLDHYFCNVCFFNVRGKPLTEVRTTSTSSKLQRRVVTREETRIQLPSISAFDFDHCYELPVTFFSHPRNISDIKFII